MSDGKLFIRFTKGGNTVLWKIAAGEQDKPLAATDCDGYGDRSVSKSNELTWGRAFCIRAEDTFLGLRQCRIRSTSTMRMLYIDQLRDLELVKRALRRNA